MTQLAEPTTNIHLSNFARFEKEQSAARPGGNAGPAPSTNGDGHAHQAGSESHAHAGPSTGTTAAATTDWLATLRRAGITRFDRAGFPTKRDELWRHSAAALAPLATLATELPRPEQAADAAALHADYTFGPDAAGELVFVNGRYLPQLSRPGKLPAGITVASLADVLLGRDAAALARLREHLGRHADIARNPFVALNAGFLAEGAFIHFAAGTTLEAPIHLLFLSTAGPTPTVSHPRVLLLADSGSRGSLVETYAGFTAGGNAAPYFTNTVTEIVVGEDAHLDYCKLQQEAPAAYHVATMQVELAARAKFISHAISTGSKTTRNDLNVVMNGEYADATLNGLVLIGGSQHVDNHTLLHHEKAYCPSHELYKHVLDGKSTGIFKGQIFVQKDAQKTDSKQTSKSLLLSDDAYMNSQPALEIYADDVKCTHGSTTGPVDEDMVFYLRTRGISLEAARHLLSYAFAADVTRRIRVEPVRRRIEDFMAAQHNLPLDLRITDTGTHDEKAR